MSITDQMQQDLMECWKLSETTGKDCGTCSWDGRSYGDIGFCEDQRIIDAVRLCNDDSDW